MTPEEAVAALDALQPHGSSGEDHIEADDILLAVVPAEVAEAYRRFVDDRANGWWYA